MSNYANTKATIDANVYENHLNQVTGPMANAAIKSVVDALIGGGFLYKGVAHPADAAVTPDANCFWIATEAGTYTNKNGYVLDGTEAVIIKYNGSWSKENTGIKLVSVSQNTSTGHTDINVGGTAYPVASVDEVYNIKQSVGVFIDDILTAEGRYIVFEGLFISGNTYKIAFSNANYDIRLIRICNTTELGNNYIQEFDMSSVREGSVNYTCSDDSYQYVQIIAGSTVTNLSCKVIFSSGVYKSINSLSDKTSEKINDCSKKSQYIVQDSIDRTLYSINAVSGVWQSIGNIYLQKDVEYTIKNKTTGNISIKGANNENIASSLASGSFSTYTPSNDVIASMLYAVNSGKVEIIKYNNKKSAIFCIEEGVFDLCNFTYTQFAVNINDGSLAANTNVRCFKIKTDNLDMISVPVFNSPSNIYGAAFYDINDNYISGALINGTIGDNVSLRVPFNTSYCLFTAYKDSISEVSLFISEIKNTVFADIVGKLRYNGQTSTNTGKDVWYTSNYMKVLEGDTYMYCGKLTSDSYICFYDENKTLLSQYNIVSSTTLAEGYDQYFTFVINQGCKYMRVCSKFKGECAYRMHPYQFKKSDVYGCIGKIDKYDIIASPSYGDTYEVEGDGLVYIVGIPCEKGDIVYYNSGWHRVENKKRLENYNEFHTDDYYDVVIVGGGSGGIGAAFALNNYGLKTLLIEREGRLGGTVSCANIRNILPTTAPLFFEEVFNKLHKYGCAYIANNGTYNDTFATYFDATEGTYNDEASINVDRYAYASVIEEMLNGVEKTFNKELVSVSCNNGIVDSIVIKDRYSGAQKIVYGKVFIDCCNGVLSKMCNSVNGTEAVEGDGYYVGADSKSLYNEDNVIDGFLGDRLAINTCESNYEIIKSNEVETLVGITGQDKGHSFRQDIINPVLFTSITDASISDISALIDGGIQKYERESYPFVRERWKYVKDNYDAFANYVFLKQSMPGIRELYRIACDNMMTQPDIAVRIDENNLGNNIACGTWYVDLHNTTGVFDIRHIPCTNCGIPYGSLLPKYLKNVIIGCKAIGASHIASAPIRITKTVMMIGNAAGYAAMSYISNNLSDLRNVVISDVQARTHLAEQAGITNNLLDNH